MPIVGKVVVKLTWFDFDINIGHVKLNMKTSGSRLLVFPPADGMDGPPNIWLDRHTMADNWIPSLLLCRLLLLVLSHLL